MTVATRPTVPAKQQTTSRAAARSQPVSRKTRLVVAAAGVVRPITAPTAARGWIGIWGTLEHVGRRTGARYTIPVAVIRAPGGFIVPMPFGTTQWVRNVLAAGGGTIRWHDRDYTAGAPDIIDWPTARPSFRGLLRLMVPLTGIHQFLRLQELAS